MFSRYDEISKLIRDYVDESLAKPMMAASALNAKIESLYEVRLSEVDLTNLVDKINVAKKCRTDYNTAVKNRAFAVTDWDNAVEKAKDIAVSREGEARAFGTLLATKVCIMLYKGPLTMDTMKTLKENQYDGTYGSPSMIQMYALYTENQRLNDENVKLNSSLTDKDKQLEQYRMNYTQLYQHSKSLETQNEDLTKINETLRTTNSQNTERMQAQAEVIQGLSDRVDHLSQKIIVQIGDMLKHFLTTHIPFMGDKQNQDENSKTMH